MYTQIKSLNIKDVKHNQIKSPRKMYNQFKRFYKDVHIIKLKGSKICTLCSIIKLKYPRKMYNQNKRFQKDVLIIKLKYSKICTLYSIMIKFKDPRKMYNQI